MANFEHLEILEQGSEGWNKWRRENPDITPDLSGANLSKANLGWADLIEANLSGADLREAILWNTALSGADLSGANLYRAELGRAGLAKANLGGAHLREANLAEVVFADLRGSAASLKNADLSGARFTRRGEGDASSGFLELATAEGLETADFGERDFLPNYLAEAFEYAHQPELPEKDEYPEFVEKAIRRIKLLRKLYPDAQPPPSLVEAVRAISSELIKYLAEHPQELYSIRPRQFEELIAEILASYGWDVNLTPETKDGGYDIFAISKDTKTATQTSWIIECKKYARRREVEIDVVRALYGVKLRLGVANALLATTSHFAKGIKSFKASVYDIELKEYEGIVEWLNTYRPNPDGRLYIKDNKLIVPGQD